MPVQYVRRAPERRDSLLASLISTGVAVGVAAATFYITRTLLARERITEVESPTLELPPTEGADTP